MYIILVFVLTVGINGKTNILTAMMSTLITRDKMSKTKYEELIKDTIPKPWYVCDEKNGICTIRGSSDLVCENIRKEDAEFIVYMRNHKPQSVI